MGCERAEGLSCAAGPWDQNQEWPGAAHLVRQLRTGNLECTHMLSFLLNWSHIRLSFFGHGLCLLLGKQRSVGAASPAFPDARNRLPRRGLSDLACGSPRRESAQPGLFVPSCA